MDSKETQAEETQRVLRLAQWAARELSEMPQDISFLKTWDKPLRRSNVRYDGQALSYKDEQLDFKIDRAGLCVGASLQEKPASSMYRHFASVVSLSILGALVLSGAAYVFEESLQAEEKRLHQGSCQYLRQQKADLETLYYRDGELSPKEYARESEKINQAWAKHLRLWPDYCPYVKENVRE